MGEVEEVGVEFFECSLALAAERANAVDDGVQTDIDFVVPLDVQVAG